MVTCPKCKGIGTVHWDKDNGKCYCCNGAGQITEQKQAYYNRKNAENEKRYQAIRENNKINEEHEKQAYEAQKIEDKKNGYTVYVETEQGNKEMRVTKQEYQNILKNIKEGFFFTSVKILDV